MLAHVNYISSAMTRLGVAGSFVGVTGDTHPDYVATYIAAVSCGGVIVPLDKDISSEQFVGFVDLCDIELIVYTSSLHKKLLEICDKVKSVKYFVCIDFAGEDFPQDERFMTFEHFLEIGREAYDAGDRTAENYVVDKEKLCTILFTSGTTGTSKGVMLNQRNLVTATIDSVSIMATSEKDSFVSVLPIHHAYEFTCSQLALPNTGAQTFINDSIKIRCAISGSTSRRRSCSFRCMWRRCTRRYGLKSRKRARLKRSKSSCRSQESSREKCAA